MEIQMKYGQQHLSLELPEQNVAAVIKPEFPIIKDPNALVKNALQNPIASPFLRELVKGKRPQKVSIIINDHSRPTPYRYLLTPLL